MSGLISSIVAFIVAGLAIFGLVPHQQPRLVPQTPQQTIPQSTNQIDSISFTATPVSGAASLVVLFDATGLSANSQYGVDFGDGSTLSTLRDYCATVTNNSCSFYHTYKLAGTYKAHLLQQNPVQGADTVFDTVTITVTGSPQSSVSVPGMSKYTDPDFGFSFWYPHGWTVTQQSTTNLSDPDNPGSTFGENLYVSDPTTESRISIAEEHFSSGTIHIAGSCSSSAVSFDSAAKQWKILASPCEGLPHGATSYYDAKDNTMGGLPTFVGQWNGLGAVFHVVPLSAASANNALVLSGSIQGFEESLMKTIVVTDPSVATPVSVNEQIKTIQAEKDAYAGQ